MRSKAYHAFEQKLNYFDDDIELIDVLKRAVDAGTLTDENSDHILRHVDPERHTHIARRQNSNGSRQLVINHLRSSIYSSYVKDIYEEVTGYFKLMLQQAALNGFNSARLVGDHSFKVQAKTVLELGSWENVCEMVSNSVFQSLEAERSTLRLIEQITAKLALNVDRNLVTAALPYLEVRHFLVHTDGQLSAEFRRDYPQIRSQNGSVILNYRFIRDFREKVATLMASIDEAVIVNDLLADDHVQP